MYYKQKYAEQQKHILDLYQFNQPPENEEHKLLSLWEEYRVEDSYQNIVLSYFDKFPNRKQLAHQIKQEIKLTYTKSTFYFKIRNLLIERDQTIQYLYQWAVALQKYKKLTERTEPNLEKVCDILDHLRKIHMLVCENVSEMLERYKCSKQIKDIKLAKYYLNIFTTFNSDLEFLKRSILKFYMPFSLGFDPLFLEQARQIGKFYAQQKIVYDANVEALFNINASYLYRLLRAHQKMLQYISICQQKQDSDDIDSVRNESSKIEESKVSRNNNDNKLAARVEAAYKHQRQVQVHAQSRHAQVQTESKSMKDKGVQQQATKERIHRYQQQKNNDTRIQRSKPTQTLPYEQEKAQVRLSLNQQFQNDSTNTMSLEKGDNVKVSNRDRQQEREATSPSTPSVRKLQPHSHRDKSQIPRGINKPIKTVSTQYQLSDDKYSYATQNFSKKETPKKRSEPYINSAQPNIKRDSLRRSDKFYLPKIDQNLKTNKKQDCFYRNKNKNKLQHPLPQELQAQIAIKRKAIINLINAKYRRLAERQKRFQLHKIRDKSLQKFESQQYKSRMKSKQKQNISSDNSLQKETERS